MPEIKRLPRISIVTPNFNQAPFLEIAILSVLNQNYPEIELIVVDGGSTDGSVELIRKYEDKISFWVSEKDRGMYDAINKGFSHSTGDIMCWLNSDDILQPGALNYVANVFTRYSKVEWLQGWPTVIDETGKEIYQREPVYSKFHFFLLNHESSFSFIQQESTFWRRSLWERAGSGLSMNYQVASDFDLWMRFFEKSKLYCTRTKLAAFRKRKGQLSGNQTRYLTEARNSVSYHFNNLLFFDKAVIKIGLAVKDLQLRTNGFTNTILSYIISAIVGKPSYIAD